MNESIMKIDRRGRLRYTPEQKKTMVDAYLASGLSAPRFASLHGVNYQTLFSWIKKGKTKDAPQPPHPALFSLIAAEIHHSPASGDPLADGGKHGMDCHETANGPPWFGKPPGGHREKRPGTAEETQ